MANQTWEGENYTGPHLWEPMNGAYMIDEVVENTSWGVKYLHVCIGLGGGSGDIPDFHVEYRSSDSSIVYRKVIVGPEYRASFVLTGASFTEISDMDLEPSGREPFPGYPDHHPGYPDHWDMDGQYNHAMAQVEPGHDWYRINATNYAFIYFSQEDVSSMIEGGDHRYDHERSMIGNGTLCFQATGDWYLRWIGPVGGEPHRFMMDGALTEEELAHSPICWS